jgi:hypothetical protein
MRHLALVLFCIEVVSGCARAPHAPAPDAVPTPAAAVADVPVVQEPALRDELLAMEAADQEVRSVLTTLFGSGERPDSTRMAAIAAQIQAVDTANTARLKQIVAQYGWPGKPIVGSDGVSAIFLLIQHADRDVAFQKEYLAWLEHAYRAGEIAPEAGEAVALLTDRVRSNEGRPQLYGTQVQVRDGKVAMLPMEDEANVDARRAALGLPPLSEYLAQLKQVYGLPD